MASALTDFGYSDAVVALVEPIIRLYHGASQEQAEAAFAAFALDLLSRVERDPRYRTVADQAFTLLDSYGSEHADELLDLSEEARALLVEGEHFHHYGDEWGPDPNEFRTLAGKMLERTGVNRRTTQ